MTEELELRRIQFPTPTVLDEQTVSPQGSIYRATTDGDTYFGSYRRRSRPQSRRGTSTGFATPATSVPPSSRPSISQSRLDSLLEDAYENQDTYGLEELRDGFFDGFFFPPARSWEMKLQDLLETTARQRSIRHVLSNQVHGAQHLFQKIIYTRSGIMLAKSFLAFFVAYIICLIPAAANWLGRYNYFMVISVILNHPGRTIGSQIDGFALTVLAGAISLGWGSLALYVSTSTGPVRANYGGILAAFFVPFTAFLAYFRSTLIRFYQAIICAGIAICYTCLADVSHSVRWHKIFEFGIPWILGQAIGLVTCTLVFPDAGSRDVAVALRSAFKALEEGLNIPRPDSREIRRKLAWHITDLADAVRDLRLDLSVTRFRPSDISALVDLLQSVIRGVLVIKPDTQLFELTQIETSQTTSSVDGQAPSNVAVMIANSLAEPTRLLIHSIEDSLETCGAVLMDLSGYRKYLGPTDDVSSDLTAAVQKLSGSIQNFEAADERLLRDPKLQDAYSNHPEVVQLLLFVHPVRLVAGRILDLAEKISEMSHAAYRIHLPSCSFVEALSLTNAQVRHDRGGLTASFYFRTKREINQTLNDMQSRPFVPVLPHEQDHNSSGPPRLAEKAKNLDHTSSATGYQRDDLTIKFRIWKVLHHLQGFESRFTFKLVAVTTILSIPAWLPQSNKWWNEEEVWWAPVYVWLMMHPRITGNFQDLVTRVFAAISGAVWGGFAYAADDGNPYVMAVFAAVFIIPMMYRFTQSNHPRSGMVGCISFTIVSLSAYTTGAKGGIFHFTWTRTCAFVVGITAAIMINWVIWPFVARHELRKSLSAMMQHLSILYRVIVAKYIYYLATEVPTSEDIESSELIEGGLRETFIRIRQLLALTRHEVRLRAPFKSRPYELLLETCEDFFEDIVQVRQSSLYFQPRLQQVSGVEGQLLNHALLPYRRDAVASILMNLYILAGALRTHRPTPRYIPSAAVARQRLLNRMAELEAAQDHDNNLALQRTLTQGRRWANVYHFAYNAALTDIVEKLETMQCITKTIVGEKGFDLPVEASGE